MISENQFNKKATTDAFDEIYTNFDVATIADEYLADSGYPFSFPTRWLNDPSMNKRIAIRRLDVIPSSHVFWLQITSASDFPFTKDVISKSAKFEITEHDNLIKVLSYICVSLSAYDEKDETKCIRRLSYEYDEKTCQLKLYMRDTTTNKKYYFAFNYTLDSIKGPDLDEFLKFLNLPKHSSSESLLMRASTTEKVFNNVWSRDRLYIHSSFSTSHRKYIGKRGDFYQNMNLLYPLPSNESIFHIFFTSDGQKHIPIRHCNFDIQLCFIVNYKKSIVL